MSEKFQILKEDGSCDEAALKQMAPELTDELMRQMYEEMIFVRAADDKPVKMQRQGRMGTYPSLQGQEACQVGPAHALDKEKDWVVPAFRELGIMVLHGVPLEKMYLYWAGDERGSNYDAKVLPVSIPVGSQPLHAVGLSWAAKIKKEQSVAMAYFSDGATSEGDFHEAMNFAGVFKTGTVFMCQNNQWAISTPRSKQTASETLAQKAQAYGFEGIQIDGNDVFACYVAARDAVKKAREGGGPTLIEAETYRMSDHTTSDDARRYQDDALFEAWKARDPIVRLQKYLASKNLWNEAFEEEVQARSKEKVSAAVEAMEATAPPTAEDLFNNTYAELTPQLAHQLKIANEK